MHKEITYRPGNINDRAGIADLLRKNELPDSDILTNTIDFILALNKSNEIIGCAGVEKYQPDGLLRSFAVDETYRNQKVGKQLLNRLFSLSRLSGIETLHLLTTTAEKYFAAAGFAVAQRNDAPTVISTTSEFSFLCASSSTYMKKDIRNTTVLHYGDIQSLKKDAETDSSYWSINGKELQFTGFEVPPQINFAAHRHKSEQVTYVLEGDLFFKIENEEYKLSGGDSILIPSGKEHSVWTEDAAAKAVDAWSPINKKYSSI